VPVGHAPGDRPGVTPGGCRHGPAVIRWWEELRSPRPGLPLGAELRRPPGDHPEQGRPESPVKDRPPRRRPPTTSGTSEPPPSRTVGVPVVSEGRLGNSPTHFPAAAVNRLPDKGGGHTLGKRRTASRRAPTHVLLDRAAIPKRHRWVSPPRTPRGLAEGGKRAVTPAGVSAAVPVVRFRSDQQLARCNHAEAQCLAHELRITCGPLPCEAWPRRVRPVRRRGYGARVSRRMKWTERIVLVGAMGLLVVLAHSSTAGNGSTLKRQGTQRGWGTRCRNDLRHGRRNNLWPPTGLLCRFANTLRSAPDRATPSDFTSAPAVSTRRLLSEAGVSLTRTRTASDSIEFRDHAARQSPCTRAHIQSSQP
jgi:hypothetical protein